MSNCEPPGPIQTHKLPEHATSAKKNIFTSHCRHPWPSITHAIIDSAPGEPPVPPYELMGNEHHDGWNLCCLCLYLTRDRCWCFIVTGNFLGSFARERIYICVGFGVPVASIRCLGTAHGYGDYLFVHQTLSYSSHGILQCLECFVLVMYTVA
jgi:hypothetical protein